MVSHYSAEDLGLTPKVGISGRQAPTEVLCREVGTLGGDDRSGDAPASVASVRGEGPHFGGERPRLAICSVGTNAAAGVQVTPPAKNQADLELGNARATTSGISVVPTGNPSRSDGSIVSPTPETSVRPTRIVGQRVDALVIAFALDVFPSIRDELQERQSIADLAGTAQLIIANLTFAMKRSRRRDSILFENADLRGSFDERAVGGWQLELIVRAIHLATHPLADVIALGRCIAVGFGTIKSARLRRFDLAVDVVGFPLRMNDTNRIVTRARIDAFIAQTKDTDEVSGEFCKPAGREHHNANHAITGFSVAQGNPLMARIYDKTVELAQPGREEKRAIEFEIWSRNGWNGIDAVTRVEFQHRGQFLDEVALRDVDSLATRLDDVWQLDVRWLRLVDPSSATRLNRCVLDPRWITLTEVVFAHVAQPATRKRQRGGATAEQVLGATLSRLASSGRLFPIELGTDGDGVFLNESTFAQRMTPDEAVAWLEDRLVTTFGTAARDAARALRGLDDPRDAIARYIAKHNSFVARFSSSDDTRTNTPEPTEGTPS